MSIIKKFINSQLIKESTENVSKFLGSAFFNKSYTTPNANIKVEKSPYEKLLKNMTTGELGQYKGHDYVDKFLSNRINVQDGRYGWTKPMRKKETE